MRKPELAAAIADKADLTKDQASRVLNIVLEEITSALNRKDSVTLVGGSAGAAVQINNVADGAVVQGSAQAVTGNQLASTNAA